MIKEGYMPYLGFQTYYRIVGEPSKLPPLLLLHGGPGSTHIYFEVLDSLAERIGRQIIMYDQLCCGGSYVEGHPELWHRETWLNELITLRKYLGLEEVHLLGHSWGGMLLLEYICHHQPEGVKSIILCSTLPSSQMWVDEQHRMLKELPEDMQAAIARVLINKDYHDPAYKAAKKEYMKRHADYDVTNDSPECLKVIPKFSAEAYQTAWGDNEFSVTGNLSDFDVTKKLQYIKQPALIISGGRDLCTPYIAKYMFDRIPDSQWELFKNCRHDCFVEDTEHYMNVLTEWFLQH